MIKRIPIEAERLTWAINRAGFSVEEITDKIPQLPDWLAGNKLPTFKQLQAFAKRVYLPFGYLLLPDLPQEKLDFPFFRTKSGVTDSVPINVYDMIQLLQQRQAWLVEYLQLNDFEPLPFVGSYEVASENIENVVADMRSILRLPRGWSATLPNWETALRKLRKHIELARIAVFSNSVVGMNTHRPIRVEDCRGFVLVNEYIPFIFINNRDAKAAQLFTLVHEVAHIFLGESAGFDYSGLQPANAKIEQFCDAVAAEFLVPTNDLLRAWEESHDFEWIARQFKGSQIVVARRALDLALVDKAAFFSFYNHRKTYWKERKSEKEAGGHFYNTMLSRLGITFASHIHDAVSSGQLLHREAYQLTGMKGSSFAKFMDEKLNGE